MTKTTVECLIEGGKATAAPPVGSSLGPLGINIGQVVSEINRKTAAFKGMKVPVKVIVDKDTREFDIEVGTPPVSALIKAELGLNKGSGMPNMDIVGNLAIEQVIKMAKMKQDSMFVRDLKSAVKSIVGSCKSIGILVEGKDAKLVIEEIDNGKYNDEILKEKTEISKEKEAILKQQLTSVQDELKRSQERLKALEEQEKAKAVKAKVEEVEEEKAEEVKEKVKEKEKEK